MASSRTSRFRTPEMLTPNRSRLGVWLSTRDGLALAAHLGVFASQIASLAAFAGPWRVIHGFSIDDAWIHQDVARSFAATGTLGYDGVRFGAGATSYLWA